VIAVRRAHNDWATDVIFARKVEWSGPTRIVGSFLRGQGVMDQAAARRGMRRTIGSAPST
jgi:hypothetical protein